MLHAKHLVLYLAVLVSAQVGTTSATAQEAVVPCAVETSSSGFYAEPLLKFELPPFRILYAVAGTHAVIDTTDLNSNGIPDYVENVARQADFMRRALNSLGFRDPLESSRYRAAKYIDISVRDIGASNGIAYDEPAVYPNVPIKTNNCALLISISRSLAVFPGTWAVVGHELFHLYQNSYSMFKASWFMEGTARWSEYAIRSGFANTVSTTPLPNSAQAMQTNVYSQSYPMAFWDRLIQQVDASPDNVIDLPASLTGATYVDGTPIMKDTYLKGAPFIQSLLQGLESESNVLTALNSWPTYRWQETDQKDVIHDPRILKVIQRAVRNTGVSNAEINGFLAIP